MKTKKLIIVLSVLISTLIIISIASCSKGEDKPNQPPTCIITSPTSGQEITKGETITIAVDATDNDGSITEVRFFIDNVGKGSTTSFPFNYNWNTDDEIIGGHALKATSFDNSGESTSDEITVDIIESSGNVPVANFIASTTTGNSPLTVNFTDQSTNNPTNWQWDFGDGGTSSQQNPSHTYNSEGNYSVSLTVSNNYGDDTESKNGYITVDNGGGNTSTFTDNRDGQTYATVVIGSQTWMAENLNYETSDSWWYDNSSAYGDVYGRLYTWDAALTACPSGWSLPSDDQWKQMEMALGMSQSEADDAGSWRGTNQGEQMKSTYGWYNNGNGTNSSGFNALPGGILSSGWFNSLGDDGIWWSSTEYSGSHAWYRGLYFADGYVNRNGYTKMYGSSVRCLKD